MKSIIGILAVVLAIGLIVLTIFKLSRVGPQDARSSSSQEWGNYQDIVELARKIQMNYWIPNANEKAQLLNQKFNDLTWKEKLRLLHLTCMEALLKGSEKSLLINDDPEALKAPRDSNRELVTKLVVEMLSGDSPFRPRHADVWQKKDGQQKERNPDIEGVLTNASLTHLGCVEVIHLDENHRPKNLDFIPFDDLWGIIFANPGLYRCAKLLFDDGRDDEIVLVPLLYGISFRTSNSLYQNGRFTRFGYHLAIPGENQSFAIGIGHQDLSIIQGGQRVLFGIGSLVEIAITLDLNDPRFDQKCRSRGIDPETVRQSMSK